MGFREAMYIFFGGLLVAEIFGYRGFRFLTKALSLRKKRLANILYWIISIGIYCLLAFTLIRYRADSLGRMNFTYVIFGLFLTYYFTKLVFGFFHLISDILFGLKKVFRKRKTPSPGTKMSRSRFLTLSGLTVASIPFTTFLDGIVRGRFNYKVFRKNVSFACLPKAFDGFKVVQISDLHLGSLPTNRNVLNDAVEIVNDLNADIVLFTGDLVNAHSSEAIPWLKTLKKIKAKHGKFSVLGNHDYGGYYDFESEEAMRADVNKIKAMHGDMGFELLLDKNVEITLGEEFIRIVGVENWGLGHFPRVGNIEKALTGSSDDDFQILLSHDPTHWQEKVLSKTKVDLTLCGHTHGMQMGVEIPGFKWSPIQYRYKRWAGLYREGLQCLYVNRGLGYLGFAGRVGIPPEITLLTLKTGTTD